VSEGDPEGSPKGSPKGSPDWKERYRSDPTTKAVVDTILNKHPEINGNPWLAEDIIKGFIKGTEALQQQMDQLQQCFLSTAQVAKGFGLINVVHDEVSIELSEAQAQHFASSFTIPKPEPVTPDRMLAALARQPELLLAVKDLMLDVRVAGPWVSFNDSEYAKVCKIGFPKGTMCRFTPSRDNNSGTTPVAKMLRRLKPHLPNRHQMDEDWEWAEQVKDHEDEVDEWEYTRWSWRIDMMFHKMFPMEGREGIATDEQGALDAADATLQAAGWVLVNP
jgi:hypothetical protein